MTEVNTTNDAKRNVRVLVIDDDAELGRTLQETLANAGYDAVVAADSFGAAAHYAENPPNVVITDLFMPDKDGLDVITDLRHCFPWVKVIAMSGNVSKENLLHAAALLGAAVTITKPFAPHMILGAVEVALRNAA